MALRHPHGHRWMLFFFVLLPSVWSVEGLLHVQSSIQPGNARRGAKHIVEGKDTNSQTIIQTPQELQDMSFLNAARTPGSLRYVSNWRDWSDKSVDAIRYHLSQNLPHPADPEGFGQLFYNLGTAADRGEMPCFADPGSRSGYALEFFCRSKLLADLIFDNYSSSIFDFSSDDTQLGSNPDDSNDFHLMSVGGACGYDYVGVLLAESFATSGQGKTCIKAKAFDYEEGWKDLVESMHTATNSALLNTNKSSLEWGGPCDITKSLADLTNKDCAASVPTTDIFICQYCIAENAKSLRESQFQFFSDLFENAKNDAVFVFTEVTPRIWPDIVDVVLRQEGGGDGFMIDFMRGERRRSGPHLVIRKREGATFNRENVFGFCDEYRRMDRLHQRKIENGYRRQARKVRGGKAFVASQ
mgnify:CR=1 FL=1